MVLFHGCLQSKLEHECALHRRGLFSSLLIHRYMHSMNRGPRDISFDIPPTCGLKGEQETSQATAQYSCNVNRNGYQGLITNVNQFRQKYTEVGHESNSVVSQVLCSKRENKTLSRLRISHGGTQENMYTLIDNYTCTLFAFSGVAKKIIHVDYSSDLNGILQILHIPKQTIKSPLIASFRTDGRGTSAICGL